MAEVKPLLDQDRLIFRNELPECSGTCFNDGMVQPAHRVTIREIAGRAGVSIATVSRVLNGRGDVADETRELVSRIIRENGYPANRNARGLSGGRTGLAGVLVPLVYPAYFASILAGAAEALSEQGLQIVLSPTGGAPRSPARAAGSRPRIAGAAIAPRSRRRGSFRIRRWSSRRCPSSSL